MDGIGKWESDADFDTLDRYALAGDIEVDPARFRVDEEPVRARRIRGEGNGVEDLSLQGREASLVSDTVRLTASPRGVPLKSLRSRFSAWGL